MKAVVTICSRHKHESSQLLPARERYTGEHIKKAEKIAKELALPLFILSGKFGLLSADEKIPYYDYYLEMSAVDNLTNVVAIQLKALGISEVDFYKENKESWIPYETTLKKAADLTGETFRVNQL
jgi:hypothetical protein